MQRSAAPSQRGLKVKLHASVTSLPVAKDSSSTDAETPTADLVANQATQPSLRTTIATPTKFKTPFKSPTILQKPGQFKSPLRPIANATAMPTGLPMKRSLESLSPSGPEKVLKLVASPHEPSTSLQSTKTSIPSSMPKNIFSSSGQAAPGATYTCFNVLWRKKTNKMHKTWDGDGILVLDGLGYSLKDMDGKEIGRGKTTPKDLSPGDELSLAGRDIELVSTLSAASYLSGQCFMSGATSSASSIQGSSVGPTTKFKGHAGLLSSGATEVAALPAAPPKPRHDPGSLHSILLPRPPATHPRVVQGWGKKRAPGDAGLVDVVVDPILGQHLRPHQKEGVRFLYECVMGMTDINGQGAILADEMGLGKTLQTIALLWTLLKQSPFHGEESSVIKKALVVCPASLIANWKREFKKWLGDERLRVFAVDAKSTLTDFTLGKVYPVMIIGYEKLRLVQDELKDAAFDIIIADEGHRLKSANIKTAQAIRSMLTRRRVILSGTPIQNDLGEFYSMIDFVNPSLFESYGSFKKVFEEPIVRSRQPDCSRLEASIGLERTLELSRLTEKFIIRRTAAVNDEYLPPKSELVVFCHSTLLQTKIYRRMLESRSLKDCFSADSSRHLMCIAALRKLCNSPQLAFEHQEDVVSSNVEADDLYTCFQDLVPTSSDPGSNGIGSELGGKMRFVEMFLRSLKRNTSERVVLVSNFTQTLDLLEDLCKRSHYGFFRLDGSTPTQKRQEYVDKFNAPTCTKFVFLLSAKSGGMGLNLIGASRLIMFDIDWNPSVDTQAMARIHREGQARPVFIYRLLLSGTIEEKIYQRQLTKIGLSDALMDGNTADKLNKFSTAELRDLFSLEEDESCMTHALLGCECGAGAVSRDSGISPSAPQPRQHQRGKMDATKIEYAKKELQEWQHIDPRSRGEACLSLASMDKILWEVVCEDAEGRAEDEGAGDHSKEAVADTRGTVGFVLARTVPRVWKEIR